MRPELEATRLRVPDPAIEVEDWLDQLHDLLNEKSLQGRAHQAYDLLAVCTKLKRVPSDSITKSGGGSDLLKAEAIIAKNSQELAMLALTVPNAAAWKAEAQALVQSYENLIDPVQRAELAETLLSDLDDAELVVYAARQSGAVDAGLNQELESCAEWLKQHADCFLAAGVYVQAMGMALRPDLSEWDPALGRTAEKFVQVLDAQEIAEAELSFANQPGIDPAVIRHVFSLARTKLLAFPRAWLSGWFSSGRALAPVAASDAQSEVLRPADLLRWSSPDKKMTALLVIPDQFVGPTDRQTLAIVFYDDEKPAICLAGQAVTLASVRSTISESAKAEFSLVDIFAAEKDLLLEVGDERAVWPPNKN